MEEHIKIENIDIKDNKNSMPLTPGSSKKESSLTRSNSTSDYNFVHILISRATSRTALNTRSSSSSESSSADGSSSLDNTILLGCNNNQTNKYPNNQGIDDSNYIPVNKKLLKEVLIDNQIATEILFRILPPRVIHDLNSGKPVVPETFENVTVFFSDIVGFTDIAAQVGPLLVVKLLNRLYSVMDYCATFFPLFKVETIGDAYMIVGGMSENSIVGHQHASDVADFALLVREVSKLVLSPSDDKPITLRIGIHSGPVAAGVVGTLMPRYCLFGNTVNCSNRMESSGMANRVHCSGDTARLLQVMGNHVIEKRGVINIKGLGDMETYWINEMTPAHKEKSNLNVPAILEKCKNIIYSISDDSIGRYPHLMVFNEEDTSSRAMTRTLSGKDISSAKSIDCISPNTCVPGDGLNVLIICDTSCIRLGVLHLLKNTLSIRSNTASSDGQEAVEKLSSRVNIFDVIVVEYNFLKQLESGLKIELLSQVARRKALSFMIVPHTEDSDGTYISSNDIDPFFNILTYPLPSVRQLKEIIKSIHNGNELLSIQKMKSPIKNYSVFRILLTCVSATASKIMGKQLRVVLEELEVMYELETASNAIEGLDICSKAAAFDLIIVDNALTIDMQSYEFLEFLRNQPKTMGSLIITLSKSSLTVTADLIASGADIIWPKPLPQKEELKSRLSRICSCFIVAI